jgi:hypothetical protein
MFAPRAAKADTTAAGSPVGPRPDPSLAPGGSPQPAPPDVAWDFSQVPVFSPDRAGGLAAPPAAGALPNRGAPVAVTGRAPIGIARQSQGGGADAAAGRPVGDAARPSVEALLSAFAAASGSEKNRIGMQAVHDVIQAYNFSTAGLADMHFEPGLTTHDGDTQELGNAARQSRVQFGPGAFANGYEWFVHVVAHELEHVAQDLIGHYRQVSGEDLYSFPVQEFLSYSGSVLQAAPVHGRPARGLLGELRTPATAPALPALPPESLALVADHVLSAWLKMSAQEQQRYWPQFQGARDRLLERISKDAPPALRPPTPDTSSPAFASWRDGVPSVYDPLSPDYDPEVARSTWSKVKDQWKKFDAVRPPAPYPAAPRPVGGVVADAAGAGAGAASDTVS